VTSFKVKKERNQNLLVNDPNCVWHLDRGESHCVQLTGSTGPIILDRQGSYLTTKTKIQQKYFSVFSNVLKQSIF
jgi:hypothetical protein